MKTSKGEKIFIVIFYLIKESVIKFYEKLIKIIQKFFVNI